MVYELVAHIRRRRLSTADVADCLGKSGALAGVAPLNRRHYRVGPVFWAYAWQDSNWTLHQQIESAPAGSVVVMSSLGGTDRALIGALTAGYLLRQRGVEAVVACGAVRDAHRLLDEDWPVWSTGTNPVGCSNQRPASAPAPAQLAPGRRFRGAIAVCDDSGVVIIEAAAQGTDLLNRLVAIEQREAAWREAIEQRGRSTFDVVCRGEWAASPSTPPAA
jgi:regulator of RNase E activity RraA